MEMSAFYMARNELASIQTASFSSISASELITCFVDTLMSDSCVLLKQHHPFISQNKFSAAFPSKRFCGDANVNARVND